MSGKAVSRRIAAELTSKGEDHVFDLYVQYGSVERVLRELRSPCSRTLFYYWVRQTPEREEKWIAARKIKADKAADDVIAIPEAVTDVEQVPLARLKVDSAKWTAERLNRDLYGNQPSQVAVSVNVGTAWLQALTGKPEGEL